MTSPDNPEIQPFAYTLLKATPFGLVGLVISNGALPSPVQAAGDTDVPLPQIDLLSGQEMMTEPVSGPMVEPVVSNIPSFSHSRGSGSFKLAQAITPANDGTGTVVTQTEEIFDITGGTQTGGNLFHSFDQFSLGQGQSANIFANPTVENVLGRVTGGNPSHINGQLRLTGDGAPNLFLMNPSGMIFGPDAQVFVPGSLTATTANAIEIGDFWFNAAGDNDYANLGAAPSGLAFTSTAPSGIINAGRLETAPGETVTLVGGSVVTTGTIHTEGGKINIAAVPGENMVRITQEGSLLSLTLPIQEQSGINDAASAFNVNDIPALLAGWQEPQNLEIVEENGILRIVSNDLPASVETGTVIVSGTVDAANSDGFGGEITILGEHVGLLKADLDVLGSSGGLVILGAAAEASPVVPSQNDEPQIVEIPQIYIDDDVTIRADAAMHGDGGGVVIHTEGITQVFGSISAKGGSESGNGGFIDVSGTDTLFFDSDIDVAAEHGDVGTLVLRSEVIDVDNGLSITDRIRLVNEILTNIFLSSSPAALGSVNFNTLNSQTGNILIEATDSIFFDNLIHQDLEIPDDETAFARDNIFFVADIDGNGEGLLTSSPESGPALGEKTIDNNDISDGASEADIEIGGSPITAIDLDSGNNGLVVPSEPTINPDESTSPIAIAPAPIAAVPEDTADSSIDFDNSTPDTGVEIQTSLADNASLDPAISENDLSTTNEPANPIVDNPEIENKDNGNYLSEPVPEINPEINNSPVGEIGDGNSGTSNIETTADNPEPSDSGWDSQDLLCEQNSIANSSGNNILTIDESLLADSFFSDTTASGDQCNSQIDVIPENASTNDIDEVSRLDEAVDITSDISSSQADVSSPSEGLSGPIIEPISDIPSFSVAPISPESL